MTPNQLRNVVANLFDRLMDTDIAVFIQPTIIQDLYGGYKRITWSSHHQNLFGAIVDSDFYKIDTYYSWIESSNFSAILYDGSIIQVTYDFDNRGKLCKHRLVYLPCPFFLDKDGIELLKDQPIIDVMDLYKDRYGESVRLRSPIRFDFDPDSMKASHPASHMTINSQDCRIPVISPLGIDKFVEFIFRHHYPELWLNQQILQDQPATKYPRFITEDEELTIHLAWRQC